jgi:hypothetical protein
MQRTEAPAHPTYESGAGPEAVREQLERILASPLFRNSKRYPSLLRYVVEQALDGHASELKERTLGIEVFGRTPDYDTNVDPVVRISAAEIRKRIAQYYHEPGHDDELRIDLPLGSYVPEFRAAAVKPAPAPEPLPAPIVFPVLTAPEPVVPPTPRPSPWRTVSAVLAIVLACTALAWWRPWAQPTALERFWQPMLSTGKPVLLCIGRTHDPDGRPHGVALTDATTMARLSGLLGSHGSTFTIRAEDQATFGDVRQNPAVLIGAFNDSWSLRLANSGRFTLHQQGDTDWIQDQQNPSSRTWEVTRPTVASGDTMTKDFGLITRVIDPATDRIMVMVGGLWGYGTLAAGEFLTDPKYMAALAQQAPAGWQKKNIQIVIGTEVIRGNSGPPKMLAFYAW